MEYNHSYRNQPISQKGSQDIAKSLSGMLVSEAIVYLEGVKNMAWKVHQYKTPSGITNLRVQVPKRPYPQKSAKSFIKSLKQFLNNVSGHAEEYMITKAYVTLAPQVKRRVYKARGRSTVINKGGMHLFFSFMKVAQVEEPDQVE